MRKCSFLALAVTLLNIADVTAASRVNITIGSDYEKANTMTVDGHRASGGLELAELSKVIKARGAEVPVIVIMPATLKFIDLNNVRGLIDKVGFTNVRYFVVWSATRKMVELKQVGPTIDAVDQIR